MKKILFIMLLAVGLVRCQVVEVLDMDPMYQLDLEGAITSPEMAELALNGAYSYLPATSTNYWMATLSGSFMSGVFMKADFITTTVAIYYMENYLPELNYNTFGDGEWDSDYGVIKNVNYLLTALEGIDEAAFEEGRKAEIEGECHYLQALSYYRLLRQFGEYWDTTSTYGLLIRDELPSIANGQKERATVGETYREIMRHIEIAERQAPAYSTPTRASVEAAKALKAEVLFLQGAWEEALTAVNEAITATNPLEGAYLDVFTKGANSKEVIFCRSFGTDELSDIDYCSDKAFNSGSWVTSPSYMALLEGDARKDLVTRQVEMESGGEMHTVDVVRKMYPDNTAVPVIFTRTAELYLIKAECLARTGAPIADAWAPVKELRARGGNTDNLTEPATREELMEEIFREWLVEMSFENWHEWFAVQRFGKLLEMNGTLAEQLEQEEANGEGDSFLERVEWRRIYNIPSSETDANMLCEKNPGY